MYYKSLPKSFEQATIVPMLTKIKTLLFALLLLVGGVLESRADCLLGPVGSLTANVQIGPAGTYTIAQLNTALTNSGCSGKLIIPSGYIIDLNTNTPINSSVNEIEIRNGGSMIVNTNYVMPASILKISLLDTDGGVASGTDNSSPSGNLYMVRWTQHLLLLPVLL